VQDKLTTSLNTLLITLPKPLVEPNVQQFLNGKKRAMTSCEATGEEEKDKAQQRCQAAMQAQAEHNKNSSWAAQMVVNS